MPETTFDLLYLIAEVSIATVALSGITMVLHMHAGMRRFEASIMIRDAIQV